MIKPDPYADHVSGRLLDFFGDRTRWARRLWDVGLTLGLREALEASEAVRGSVLSEGAFKGLCGSLCAKAGPDPGVGSAEEHGSLQRCLTEDLSYGGAGYFRLQDLQASIQKQYLTKWVDAIRLPANRPTPEYAARSIGSHVLDAGLNQRFLHRWWTRHAVHGSASHPLEDLVEGLRGLVARPPKQFEVLVAFSASPSVSSTSTPEWRSATQVADWLRQNAATTRGVRQNGGLVIQIKASSEDAAIDRVAEIVDRLSARVAVGTRGRLEALEDVWVAGKSQPYSLRRTRHVEVLALNREQRIFSLQEKNSAVDSALELVAPLDDGPPAPAIAGGWAAVESLLVGPGDTKDRGVAAERLATLVTCSWPRAELTSLAYEHAKWGADALATELDSSPTNFQKARLIAAAIVAGTPLALKSTSDSAARVRMAELIAKPREVLPRVEKYCAASIRRLYRQRNLILHGGRTETVALRACLRTVAPLVGAGIDRVAHSWFVDGLQPLELSARAKNQLDLVGTPAGCSPNDLLS